MATSWARSGPLTSPVCEEAQETRSRACESSSLANNGSQVSMRGQQSKTGFLQSQQARHSVAAPSWCITYAEKGLRCLKTASSSQLSARCAVLVKESYGAASIKGSGRAVYEDTYAVEVDATGKAPSFFGVFDGHGGPAVANYLKTALWPVYKQKLAEGSNPLRASMAAYQEVDAATIAAPKGFFGALRQRGMGGDRCGATAATLVLLPVGDKWQLLAANVGDSRTVLARGGKAVQLSVDHKPNVESERARIEAKNPTPMKPLVQNVGGTWRVGGLLALSRAFGDVYLKDWSDGLKDGARGGFGLTAEPSMALEELTPEDAWVILGTDGLWDYLDIQEAVDICQSAGDTSLDHLAEKLLKLSIERGSTDDVTVVIVRLPKGSST